ncbi:hypothetical protein [Mycolicibacterium sphagni]|uniref:PE-PGRS family protein n=1 Tax=Mycolicibacterium sphagni TaxID=1786 RepID=A0A255DJT5_9MYCO|nr:hypothetical protein [Mycolicibacterium sphagni]OYN77505.1 hypothetical protein CG716_18445 [Mycolicibacterium sphagni]
MRKANLVAALPLCALMAGAAIGGAPLAAASCSSFFGLGNTAQCKSGPTSIAIAVGPNATATAGGLFGVAFADGIVPLVGTTDTGVATATSTGAFTFAWAWGDNVTAQAGDLFGIAMQLGTNGTTTTKGLFNVAQAITNPFGSTTADIGLTLADGIGNVITNGAFVTGPGDSVEAVGLGNYAFNGWGSDNVVKAGGTPTSLWNFALDVFNSGNVTAGPGPFAIAIAFGQQPGDTTVQTGPGIKIGYPTTSTAGSAAALHPIKKTVTKPVVSAAGGTKTSVGSAAPRVHKAQA